MEMLGVRLLVLVLIGSGLVGPGRAHEESGEWSCESEPGIRVEAEFRPGLVTIDGHADDWKAIAGSDFSLLPALDPDADKEYKDGKLTVKALHDGRDAFFLLQVDGDYAYSKGNGNNCPSVALMFQIGDDATYHNMGGCKEGTATCNNKTCKGHEVDIMHFSIGDAVPGRLYGSNPVDNSDGNGGDRYGHLVDLYSWTPHCRYLDGKGPSGNISGAQNDWQGAWWHSTLNVHSGFVEEDNPYAHNGQKGTYYFEFSRPLRTTDRFQQDAQFTIGSSSKMAAAFWYPADGKPWHGSGHYGINCDWIELDFTPGTSTVSTKAPTSSNDVTGAFALLFSVVAICLSTFVAYRVARPRNVPFVAMQMDNL